MHDIRFATNMSLLELAEKTNIDIEVLRKFEAGEFSNANIALYFKIANGLDVSMKEFTKGIEFVED